MVLKSLWGKSKKRTGTPKSDSLSFSVTDSENSYKIEMLEVTNEATADESKPDDSSGGEEAANVAVEEGGDAAGEGDADEAPKEESADSSAETDSDDQPSDVPPRTPPVVSGGEANETPAPRRKRSRATTVGTTPEPGNEYESQERREKEQAMIRLWRKATTPKKLPFPSRYPGYLKEPPELSFEDTHASMRRRLYNDTRIKELREEPFKRDESKVKHLSPKTNRTVELRSKYIRREPLVSKYFSDHYNDHKKPPFKNTNVKYYN